MATSLDLIKRSLRLLGVYGSGESIPSDEASDAQIAMNAMLEDWRNEKLMAYAMRDESLTMVTGQASYGLGPTGDLVTTRPVKIDNAYIRDASTDYPVEIVSRDQWDGIPDKTNDSDIVQHLLFEGTMPDATIQVWPVPTTANVLHLRTWLPLATVSLTDTITLPPGYENAITYSLALYLAPEYGIDAKPSVMQIASRSLAGIKRINQREIRSKSDLFLLFDDISSNILTDTTR